MAGPRLTSETLIMNGLLLLVPATLLAAKFDVAPWAQFFLAVGAVIPLAAYIGWATEALADHLGGKVGGLLNATFGNAPDLLVGVFGVQKGLIPLVKATLIGGLISNSALIMGICYIVAGLVYRRPTFHRQEAGHHSVLLMLTVAAVLFPSVGSFVPCQAADCAGLGGRILGVSVGIAVVLLLAYTAYVLFGIFGLESLGRGKPEPPAVQALPPPEVAERSGRNWSPAFSVVVLGLATIGLLPVTDILTGSVQPMTEVLGWSQVFVGMVIVANAGNVAEAYAAIRLAKQRAGTPREAAGGDSGLDLALGIASASSIQIATFVAPLVVLYSLLTSHPMTLVFSPVEISILALLVIMSTFIGQDGESNWLEGAQLLALYAMAAIVFYALPVSLFGS
jgi:Ca2+:H+ antiporter